MDSLRGKGYCSAIYFLNLRSEVLVHRAYRDDVGCEARSPTPALRGPAALRRRLCAPGLRVICPREHAHTLAPGAGESKHAPQLSAMRRVVHRRHMAEAFRTQVLQSKESSAPPVVTLGSCSFLWTREVRSPKPELGLSCIG